MRSLSTQTALILTIALAGATTANAQDLTNSGIQLTVGPGALLAVPGALVNQAGATLTTEGTVQVGGNFTNAGTVVPGSGTVVLNGTTDQTLQSGGATLANLEVRNTGSSGQNRVLLPADLSVTQQLLLTSGLVRTAPSATLRLAAGAALAGEAPGRYVQGNLAVTRNAVRGTAPLNFGHGFVLTPNGNTLGTVEVTRSAGLRQAGLSFGQNPANSAQRSIDRVWRVTAAQPPTTPVDLALSWLPDDDNGLTDFTRAQTWRMPTGQTAWQAAGPRADARARGIVATTTALGAFTVSNAGNPLPVELLHFTAERRGPDALLRWATVSEKNNDRFEVESSPDGRAFRRVATVFSKNGNSPQRQDYTLTDPNLTRYAADVIYYRLRQVDRDGTAQYSPVRTVAAPAENGFAAQAYPQPFATELTLLIRTDEAGPVIMRLHDAVGRALLTRTAALQPGAASVPLPAVAALPPGVYVLSITQNKYHRTVKVVRE